MKKIIKALKFPTIFTLFFLILVSCDKDFTSIESDVLGKENSNFNTNSDVIVVSAYNKKLDSLQVNGLASNLLGVFKDPSYGTTIASIVTQVTPARFNPDFGVNPIIDSVVVNIPYFSTQIGVDENSNAIYKLDSLYGNPEAEFKLTIYQNNYFLRDFDPNSTLNNAQNFYSNANSTLNSVLTGSSNVNFDDHIAAIIHEDLQFLPTANAVVTKTGSGDNLIETRSAPAYRVTLNDPEDISYWTNTIIAKQDSPELSNANNFKDYFRGLYLKVEAVGNDGNMILLNLASTNANITINYTSGETDSRTQSTYTLNFVGNRVNTFINNYNLVTLQNGDPVLGDEKLYLKGASGSMGVVDILGNNQGLEDFLNTYRIPNGLGGYEKDNNGNYILRRLINEAHLVIYEDEGIPNEEDENGDVYHKYDRIYAYDIDNNTPTVDYQLDPTENNNAINSKLISLGQRDSSGRYKIILTEHLNNILLRDSTNTKIGLVLSNNVNYTTTNKILNSNDDVTAFPAAAIISPRGTILYGSNTNVPEEKKLKFKIFYTEPDRN
ncbi:DUF4270 domain-containing protein [Litoribaculum gwangyangense]|uniref:DUF4270 domain-containing protein n=1 Tax=Litoribaculum gwangyangense TaxID=1130722 RepID=A0ABP9C4V0_9FLAO